MSLLKIADKAWRLFATGLSFTAFGLGAFFLALALLICLYPLPIKQTHKQILTRRAISRATKLHIAIMRTLGLLSFDFENSARLNCSGELVIANHPSLIDTVFLLSVMPDACCIVKESLWRNPFTFGVVSMAGYISNNNNGPQLVDKAAAAIRAAQSLIVFPEGTRTGDTNNLTFKRGAANIALKAQCPIRPVAITCTPRTLRKHESWYNIPDSPPHFTIAVMEQIEISDCIDTARPANIQANKLNQYLEELLSMQLSMTT